MSTLNLGNSPILKPMENGTSIWENTIVRITVDWYKKDNVVDMFVAWKLKANLGKNQNSGYIDKPANFPSSCCPPILKNFPTLNGEFPCAVELNPSGKIRFFSYASFLTNYGGTAEMVYLVND